MHFDKAISYQDLAYTYIPEKSSWLSGLGMGGIELAALKRLGIINPRYTAVYATDTQLLVTGHTSPYCDSAMYYAKPLPVFTHTLTWLSIPDDGTAIYNSWGDTKRYLVYTPRITDFWFSWRLDFESKNPLGGRIDKGFYLVAEFMPDSVYSGLKPYKPYDSLLESSIERLKRTLPFMLPVKIV